MDKLYLAVFFTCNWYVEWFFFLRFVVMHRLVAYFIKSVHQNFILSQNTLSKKKVKI